MTNPLLTVSNIGIHYDSSDFSLKVSDFALEQEEFCALVGPSGCGKTTFIEILAGVITPSHGSVQMNGIEVQALTEEERRSHRLRSIGFVFQQFELLPYLTVLDNVLLPIRLERSPESADRDRAADLLSSLGLSSKELQYPDQLSQGEKQRVAIARSVIREPALIIADEPTGNLDSRTTDIVMNLLFQVAEEMHASMLVVTHDTSILSRFKVIHECEELFTR